MTEKRVLVFGTFDGLHPGHLFFLRASKARGTKLIVAVARDAHVKELKDKRPATPEAKRLEAIRALSFVDEAFMCDEELGAYTILQKVRPDLILLGHDQQALEKDLIRFMSHEGHYIPMARLKKI
ncbi:MAG: adenylyltransferase/cytidyltransferase family protein [Patescibacteria group bacterium]